MDDAPIIRTPADFPTPAGSARRADPAGVDVTLADGRAWTLAGYIPALGGVWDRLYDDNLVAGRYKLPDVLLGAARLLLENYDLPADFAGWLLIGADPDALVTAVEAALFGGRHEPASYSDWATGALYANGIDPRTVPPEMLRPVLRHLVAAGRAVPHAEYTGAGIAAGKRAAIAEKFARAEALRQAGREVAP